MKNPLKRITLYGRIAYTGTIPGYDKTGFWEIMEHFLFYWKTNAAGIVLLLEEKELTKLFAGYDWQMLFRLIGCDFFHCPLPQDNSDCKVRGIFKMMADLDEKLQQGPLIFLSSEDGERCRRIISMLRQWGKRRDLFNQFSTEIDL